MSKYFYLQALYVCFFLYECVCNRSTVWFRSGAHLNIHVFALTRLNMHVFALTHLLRLFALAKTTYTECVQECMKLTTETAIGQKAISEVSLIMRLSVNVVLGESCFPLYSGCFCAVA